MSRKTPIDELAECLPEAQGAMVRKMREHWLSAHVSLGVAVESARTASEPDAQREWLQGVIGFCDALKASTVAYSAAIGYTRRKTEGR